MDYRERKVINLLGLVKSFDGFSGVISSSGGEYIFLKEDVLDEIKEGDLVLFKGETIHDIKKAFFIKKKSDIEGSN